MLLGKVTKKNPEKVWSFAKPGGGPEVYINNQPPSAIRGGGGKRPPFFRIFFCTFPYLDNALQVKLH